MHILLIHQSFAAMGEPGGTRHHEFARLLARRGHTVTIIASPVSYITGDDKHFAALNYEKCPEDERITILRAKTYRAMHRSFFHRVFVFVSFMTSSFFMGLNVKGVDLVWGSSPPIFQGATAWALARIKRVPFLFEVRDLWPLFAIAVGVLKNRILIRMSEWLERFLYTRADQLIINSPGFREHVLARGAQKLKLIPNGADPAMFLPENDGSDFRKAHGLSDKFVVMYAGAHGMSNDLGVVLRAAQLISDQTDIHIVFVGDGKDKQKLIKLANELQLKNVTFLPSVPKAEIGAVMAGAHAGIAILKPLDEYKTTYPNKVFDYMAAGRPQVLAIDGVAREVVEAAACGIFTAPGDAQAVAHAIRQLAKDPLTASQMGRNGRKYLEEHFSREAISRQLVQTLEAMVN